ncbi:hypothetical protein BU15DRAFT_63552 [Melanogaster broomeanus]|nr:hypothetical protein BU15DRAFT_63552 [Melanogaster broomeanus]
MPAPATPKATNIFSTMLTTPKAMHLPVIQPSLCTLPSHLILMCNNLIDLGLYLSDKAVIKNVHWVRKGRADRLAIKPAAPLDPNLDTATGSAKYLSRPPDDPIELALLSAIVQLCSQDFWITSDGGYRIPSKIWQQLANVKLSCMAKEPDMQPVREDFKTVIGNLGQLQQMISMPGYQPGKGFILPGGISGKCIKVQHALFEPLDADEIESAVGSADNKDLPDTATQSSATEPSDKMSASGFTMENWPLTDKSAQDELEDLRAMYRIVPVPAYNLQGHLIKPAAYRRSLENALVELHFNLSHGSITGKNGQLGNDVFTADDHLIRVIAPPRSSVTGTPSTPRKCKISLYINPSESSPTAKKIHCD